MEAYTESTTSCNTPRLRGWLVNRATRRYLRCPCGRWRCDGCGRYKARVVARRFTALAAACGRYHRLLTVTLAEIPSESEAKRRMRSFRRWMARHGVTVHGSENWVREFGARRGRLHFHALVCTNMRVLPYAKMQAAARRCGLGNLDVRRAASGAAIASYVAKYLAKDLLSSRGAGRRFYCAAPAPAPSGEWQWLPSSPEIEAAENAKYKGESVYALHSEANARTMRDLPPAPPNERYGAVAWEDGVLRPCPKRFFH